MEACPHQSWAQTDQNPALLPDGGSTADLLWVTPHCLPPPPPADQPRAGSRHCAPYPRPQHHPRRRPAHRVPPGPPLRLRPQGGYHWRRAAAGGLGHRQGGAHAGEARGRGGHSGGGQVRPLYHTLCGTVRHSAPHRTALLGPCTTACSSWLPLPDRAFVCSNPVSTAPSLVPAAHPPAPCSGARAMCGPPPSTCPTAPRWRTGT